MGNWLGVQPIFHGKRVLALILGRRMGNEQPIQTLHALFFMPSIEESEGTIVV